jgi:protein transport protein SEC61 subunit gamma and related proteins
VKGAVAQVQDFVKDSAMFYSKCKKPDYAEYMKILQACVMGFIVMGSIGYLIKLVFIPINNIILS